MPRHHIVPKMILRRFASGEKLQAVPRDGGSAVPMTVETACAERDFYELQLELEYQDEFPPNRVEEAFSNFEGRAHPIIDRLTNGVDPEGLTDQNRFDLTALVALQLSRGWAFRDSFVEALSLRALIETVTPDRVRGWLEKQGLPCDEDAVQEFSQSTLNSGVRLVPPKGLLVQVMLKFAFEQAHPQLFSERFVSVVVFEDPVLLTSDEPTVLWNHPGRRNQPLGVATADGVWMPLDRRHALLLDRRRPEGLWKGDADLAGELNTRVATGARKWIFQHPDETPINVTKLPSAPRWKHDVVKVLQSGYEVRTTHLLSRR